MDPTKHQSKRVNRSSSAKIAVAIPARNEAQSIIPCMEALDLACAAIDHQSVTIFVSVNNSWDQTANHAREFKPQFARLVVEEIELPSCDAHAGGARRRAMDQAALIVGANGILMTTDADSEVSPDWILANLAELDDGADAVAGTVTFKPKDRLHLMPMLLARTAEWRLANLQARLTTLIDPLPYDPWPNHIWEWGASLAVKAHAYRSIGGLPSIPLAEDRAFAKALNCHDFKLRHSHAPLVYTSGRLAGRAPQGFADLLSDYCHSPDTACDAAIEPTVNLVHRLLARKSLRQLHGRRAGFGARWHNEEIHDERLHRSRVYPAELNSEVDYAEAVIRQFEKAGTHRFDTVLAGL